MFRLKSVTVGLVVICLSGLLALQAGSVKPILKLEKTRLQSESKRLYQDERITQSQQALSVILVGDILLGRGVAANSEIFYRVAPRLGSADIAIGNLEGMISAEKLSRDRGIPLAEYQLFAPPIATAQLQDAGFDLIGIANNHAVDGGWEVRANTAARLKKAGITPLGRFPGDTVTYYSRGVRLVVLAFNAVQVPGTPELIWDQNQALSAVREASERADAVIVMMHWGSEFDTQAGTRQKKAASLLAEAGADLIAGSHPHVIQDAEVIERSNGRRTLVAYSLGNFVFDQQFDFETRRGASLVAIFTRNGLVDVRALGVKTDLSPAWVDWDEEGGIFRRLVPAPRNWKIACRHYSCILSASMGKDTNRKSVILDEIDLTGDGRDERVSIQDRRVTIYEEGRQAWVSPQGWDVRDFTLGDPNDDGRFEVLLAVDKTNSEGELESHPFIIGYRGGSYRQVWGGSAVADPISEVALADVDRDGKTEMIVLEERCKLAIQRDAPAQCDRIILSVWRWNGWGFTQFWKSRSGNFKNLDVTSGPIFVHHISVEEDW